jgi:hypothetical protein
MNETEKRKTEVNDFQHKRTVKLIAVFLLIIFTLCLVSLFLNQFELVKWILSSSFAVGAGAGITNFLKKNK